MYDACQAVGYFAKYYQILLNCQVRGNCQKGESTYEMKYDQLGNVKCYYILL